MLIRNDHKAIKIGYAGDLLKRLTLLNRQREREGKRPGILLYAVGMTGAQVFAAEAEIKALLADHRNGDGVEWFTFSGQVLETIKATIEKHDPHYKAHLFDGSK
ncbi:TPA: GIY-YIG nuclease family protein [Salmonella enterica subsp. enterica serovar Virchow]